MADHRNPGISCHLITEARSAGVRVVLVGSGSNEGSLGIFTPPRSSSSLGQCVALAKHPAASRLVQQRQGGLTLAPIWGSQLG